MRRATAPYRTGNTLFADPGELRAVAGMTPEIYPRLRPWLCALPISDLSPININTLRPEQAPLLAMLAPGQLERRARRGGCSRRGRAAGWGNQIEFWRIEAMSDLNVPLDVQLQPQLKTNWFTLDVARPRRQTRASTSTSWSIHSSLSSTLRAHR